MTAAWPLSTVPQLQDGYSEVSERSVVEFQPEIGRPVRRRRTSRNDKLITCKGWFSSADVQSINAFYNSTTKSGTLQFTMPHPRTKSSATWLLLDPPHVAAAFGKTFEVEFKLRLISGGNIPPSLQFNSSVNSQYLGGL